MARFAIKDDAPAFSALTTCCWRGMWCRRVRSRWQDQMPGERRARQVAKLTIFNMACSRHRMDRLTWVEGLLSRGAGECVLAGDAVPTRFLRKKRQRAGRTVNAPERERWEQRERVVAQLKRASFPLGNGAAGEDLDRRPCRATNGSSGAARGRPRAAPARARGPADPSSSGSGSLRSSGTTKYTVAILRKIIRSRRSRS